MKETWKIFDTPSSEESPAFLARAYYTMDENRLYIYAGLLQPPFYYEDGSLATIFGAIGWVISHEVFHAISIKGVQIDANSNKRTSFSALLSSSSMQRKLTCMREQYSHYAHTSYKAFQIDTQEEIVADNGGIKAAYQTYRRLLQKSLENVSQDHDLLLESDRSFFLSFAKNTNGAFFNITMSNIHHL
ncbi:unnamed protein product [Schistosoma turkestanicum]|nr:unnamed protein product [Schistosoma turkestanicum]